AVKGAPREAEAAERGAGRHERGELPRDAEGPDTAEGPDAAGGNKARARAGGGGRASVRGSSDPRRVRGRGGEEPAAAAHGVWPGEVTTMVLLVLVSCVL